MYSISFYFWFCFWFGFFWFWFWFWWGFFPDLFSIQRNSSHLAELYQIIETSKFVKHISETHFNKVSVLDVKTWNNQSDITETNGFHKIICNETRFYDPEAFIRMSAPSWAQFCSSNHVLAVQYLHSIPHCIYDSICFWFKSLPNLF